MLFLSGLDNYYQNYLTVVLKREPFDTFMQLYSQLTPHIWAPNRDFFSRLLNEIKDRAAVQYLGKPQRSTEYKF
jgi:hypothetical protein